MPDTLQRGAQIVISKWINLKAQERLLIISNERYRPEVAALCAAAFDAGGKADVIMAEELSFHISEVLDNDPAALSDYDAVIGATEYSLITTQAVKHAVAQRKRFLSLPLSTNDGKPFLGHEFLTMDTDESRRMAEKLLEVCNRSETIEVTTPSGTHLRCRKRGRQAGFFNGCCACSHCLSSASMEVYIPIEEDQTEGTIVLDGSMGYIGKVSEPVRIMLSGGRITDIQANTDGRRLKEYLEHFNDPRMWVAAEFGIGLNTVSKCCGNCYIEDESAYGTFHIGFGRNIALGGIHEACGHFDLVTFAPDIYMDGKQVMRSGELCLT